MESNKKPLTPATVTSTMVRDLTVSNLIDNWSGEGPVSVTEFFNKIDRAAKSGNWSDSDKITVAILKLTGQAALFLSSSEEANRDDISYQRFRDIFVERFKIKHLDQFHYSALQNASQHRNETPEQFADRCRRLCSRTIRQVPDPNQQAIINEEAERRMLAAYINGLFGIVGKQVRYRMPSTLTEAILIATTVSEVEAIEARKNPNKDGNLFAICFNCKKPGHIAKNCRLNKTPVNSNNFKRPNKVFSGYNSNKNQSQKLNTPKAFSGNNTNNNNNGTFRTSGHVQCYACQKFGHYARECRSKQARPNEVSSPGTSTGLTN